MPCYIMYSFHSIQLLICGCSACHLFFNCLREEEREDLDTSTESKETERKEQDVDTVTEDEEELGPNKKGRRGNTCAHVCLRECMHTTGQFLFKLSVNISLHNFLKKIMIIVGY